MAFIGDFETKTVAGEVRRVLCLPREASESTWKLKVVQLLNNRILKSRLQRVKP